MVTSLQACDWADVLVYVIVLFDLHLNTYILYTYY